MIAAIHQFRVFIKWVLGTFFVCLMAMVAANAIFDPLHILSPPEQRDYYDRQTRYALPGLLRKNETEVAIIGTSVIQDFDEEYFEGLWEREITRYPVLGGTGYEQRRLLETLLGAKTPPKTVIWGLDVASFTGKLDNIRWAKFPEHLFRNDDWVIPKYLFSFETFYRLVRLIPDYQKTYTPETRFRFQVPDLEFSRNAVLKTYCGEGLEKRINNLYMFDFSTQKQQVMSNLVTPLKSHLETDFILFFPPYSAVQYAEFDRAGVLEHVLSFREHVLNEVKDLENVTLYDFQSVGEVAKNLEDYRDPFHYGQNTMHWMAEAWKDERHILTSANLERRQQSVRVFAQEYSSIWDEVEGFCED